MPKMLKRAALSFATLLVAVFMSLAVSGVAYADEVAMTLGFYSEDTPIGEQQADGQYFEITAPIPENGDMTFCGWTDDIELKEKIYHTGNIVDISTLATFDGTEAKLYAVWGTNETSSFYAKYDGSEIYSDTECTEAAATPIPTCPGYEFLGYYAEPECITLVIGPDGKFAADNIDGYVANGNWAMTQNITLYAGWKQIDRYDADEVSNPIAAQFENLIKYVIDFDSNIPNDEAKIPSVEKESTFDQEQLQIPLDVPQNENRDFICWNTEADGSGESYKPGDVIELQRGSPGAVLYAIWAVHLNDDKEDAVVVLETFTIDGVEFQANAEQTWKEWVQAQEAGKYTFVKETVEDGTEIEMIAIIDDEGVVHALYDETGNKLKADSLIIVKDKSNKYTTQLPEVKTEQITVAEQTTIAEIQNENTAQTQEQTITFETGQNTTE